MRARIPHTPCTVNTPHPHNFVQYVTTAGR
nr:MAG TPA: hypothetical protein [Caudoviricetes sp.]